MHDHASDGLSHPHIFLGAQHAANERRTFAVVGLTLAMMICEIVGGLLFGSMALIADGLHVDRCGRPRRLGLRLSLCTPSCGGSALCLRHGEVGDLAAFASGLALAIVALFIGYEAFSGSSLLSRFTIPRRWPSPRSASLSMSRAPGSLRIRTIILMAMIMIIRMPRMTMITMITIISTLTRI